MKNNLPLKEISPSWTLFLDRDGVINYEKQADYIHTWDEFRFYEGVTEAMKIVAAKFGQIVIVTNQKGVGKGLTKIADLETIHTNMRAEVEAAGGRIDAIYFCSDLDDSSPGRKPNPSMGLQAVKDIPAIDLTKAIMVGNTSSDMEFGRNLGVYTVFLPTTRPEVDLRDERIDAVFPSLLAFAQAVEKVES